MKVVFLLRKKTTFTEASLFIFGLRTDVTALVIEKFEAEGREFANFLKSLFFFLFFFEHFLFEKSKSLRKIQNAFVKIKNRVN